MRGIASSGAYKRSCFFKNRGRAMADRRSTTSAPLSPIIIVGPGQGAPNCAFQRIPLGAQEGCRSWTRVSGGTLVLMVRGILCSM